MNYVYTTPTGRHLTGFMQALYKVKPEVYADFKRDVYGPLMAYNKDFLGGLRQNTGIKTIAECDGTRGAYEAFCTWLLRYNLVRPYVVQYLLLTMFDWTQNADDEEVCRPYTPPAIPKIKRKRAQKKSQAGTVIDLTDFISKEPQGPQPPEYGWLQTEGEYLEEVRLYMREKRAWEKTPAEDGLCQINNRFVEQVRNAMYQDLAPFRKDDLRQYEWAALYQCFEMSLGDVAKRLGNQGIATDDWRIYRAIIRTLSATGIPPRKGLRGAKN